ncbi:TPA: hypothetical protein N0F65_011364 [Lagenidium giganteum]|uniref:Sphingomyelin phosphodiesterase 4 n=1 Tax=Lagenidium giganteum TaxID=4803 RepID=A0AAV2Z8J9_9STRA|nr:TPA: hypothetical protein N0F65_011364 [Lagenidium giganteum]
MAARTTMALSGRAAAPLRQTSSGSSSGGDGAGAAARPERSLSPGADGSAAVAIGFETDAEFAQLIQSYNVPVACDALRRYLAVELQSSLSTASSKQQSALLKGKFYERFNQILDRVFGNDDVSKHKYGGWLEYSTGLPITTGVVLQKRPSSVGAASGDGANGNGGSSANCGATKGCDMKELVTGLTTAGQALVRVLSGDPRDDCSVFHFLFRVSHPVEFKLEFDMLPEQSKVSLLARSPYTSALFTQLLHKPVAKQFLDPRHPVLLVTISELFLFYFLRHPTASHQAGAAAAESTAVDSAAARKRTSSLMGSLSESFGSGKPKRRSDYSWRMFTQDGVVSLTKGNPYNVLLLQYLRVFLPDSALRVDSRLHAKILQLSNVFLHILIESWLRQNLIIFSDSDAGSATVTTHMDMFAARSRLLPPLATVHTSTTYTPPSDELLCSLLLTIVHLLSDSFYPAPLRQTGSERRLTGGPPSSSGGPAGLGSGYLTPSVAVMRRPLFEFFRLVFSRAPIGLTPTAFLALTDVWLAYLQPWCCKSWARGQAHNSDDPDAQYSAKWESYVLANYHFYTTLLGSFVERAKELELSASDERNLNTLDRVLGVYTSDLLVLLRSASEFLENSPKHTTASFYSSSGLRSRQKSIDCGRDGLTAEQGHVLTYHCRALGFDTTPVPLHATFHRDAERLFDKLMADSGYAGLDDASSSSTSSATTTPPPPSASSSDFIGMFRSGFGNSADKYSERVRRLSTRLRRVFDISDEYVASSTHCRVLPSSSLAQALMSFEPSRDSKLHHLLTATGLLQLKRGYRKCSPEAAAYVGDPMLRPIRSYEIGWLVRLAYRASMWLNAQCGLANPYTSRRFEDNVAVDASGTAGQVFRFNLRFLASKPNLVALTIVLFFTYLVYLS